MSTSKRPEDAIELAVVDESPEDLLDHDDDELDEETIADGNHLGATIDIEDDTDSGAREVYL